MTPELLGKDPPAARPAKFDPFGDYRRSQSKKRERGNEVKKPHLHDRFSIPRSNFTSHQRRTSRQDSTYRYNHDALEQLYRPHAHRYRQVGPSTSHNPGNLSGNDPRQCPRCPRRLLRCARYVHCVRSTRQNWHSHLRRCR